MPSSPTALERDYAIHTSFVRGGLAACASAFFKQSQTSLILWQKETEHHANTLLSSDLCVNIIKILQKSLPLGLKLISPGIALCRIWCEANYDTPHHKLYNNDELSHHFLLSELLDQVHRITHFEIMQF